jgi:cytochrome d ubiquinol oxidase subunit II
MMGLIWFWLVAIMLAAYVLLDGFDFGVGALYPFLAKTEEERRMVLRSIGPVWDGNEVWLLAGGGTLFFAFPLLYASAFSGFYLPLMIVLWLLILRGVGLELRNHIENVVCKQLLGGIFALASTLLPVFYGAALGNVLRGVPLNANGYFFLPLWTNFRVGPNPGILDWYTVLAGVVALVALSLHGALWLALKTNDPVESRARAAAQNLWRVLLVLTPASLAATLWVHPQGLQNYTAFPPAFVIPAAVAAGLFGAYYFNRMARPLAAFLSSCLYLFSMLAGAAYALYPSLLPSIVNPAEDLTISRSLSGPYALHVGLVWWTFGMALAISYFSLVYWMFRGKVRAEMY